MKKITFKAFLGMALLFSAMSYAQPANDDFANAEALLCGTTVTGTTATATLDQADPALYYGVDLDAPNVWYSYTGSGSEESITLDLCGSGYDTSILVLTGLPGSLTAIAGNDDNGACASNTLNSAVTFTSDGLTTYYIAVEGYNVGSVGAYTMSVTCTSVTPPAVANQTCATALDIPVDASINDSDNSYGDVSSTQPTCDTFGSIQDVWFSFVAPSATTSITITRGTLTSANYAVYSGDCATLASIGCRSNLIAATDTLALTTLTSGNTYYVQVWSNAAEQGTFTISLSDPSVCLPAATFDKSSNCPSDTTFYVTADITSLASATSVTVTDNQASTPQTVSSTGLVTFGPYANGVSVVLTVTNDQSPGCFVTSPIETYAACPATNDLCADAVTIACGDTLTGQSTVGATGGTPTSCVGTIGDDVWYTFTGDGQINTLVATATGASDGAQVEVYESTDGTCAGFTPGSCFASAGSGETATTVNFVSVLGNIYYIHIGNWINGDPAIAFDLSLTCTAPPTPPANDECSGAIDLTVNGDASCGSTASGTVSGATPSAVDAAACGGTEDDDVWFSFTATETAHGISLLNAAGSTTDLYHSLWTGDCASLTLVPGSCSDANSSTPSGLTPGTVYYVRVYTTTGTGLQNSTFDICVGTLPLAPDNDDCSNAVALSVGNTIADFPVVGTTVSALSTSGLTFACQTNRVNDVWYSVEVPASGVLTLETAADPGTTMTDSVLSVFSGTCGSLTEIGCDDDTGTGNFSKVALTGLTPGDVLYVGVWRYSLGVGVDGAFQVSAYDPTLGTSTFNNAKFVYYPNPVKDVLNLSYNKTITNVAVYNLLGQQVMAKTLNSNLSRVDMSHLSAGTYMVKVTVDGDVKTVKVVKQ